jgi:hypothetical protein
MKTDISGEWRAKYPDAARTELERLGVTSRTLEQRGGSVVRRVLSPEDHRLSEELTYAEVVAGPLARPLLCHRAAAAGALTAALRMAGVER